MFHKLALLQKLTANQLEAFLTKDPVCSRKGTQAFVMREALKSLEIPDDVINELLLSTANILEDAQHPAAYDYYKEIDQQNGTRLALDYAVRSGSMHVLSLCPASSLTWLNFITAGDIALKDRYDLIGAAHCFAHIIKTEELRRERSARIRARKCLRITLTEAAITLDTSTINCCCDALKREMTTQEIALMRKSLMTLTSVVNDGNNVNSHTIKFFDKHGNETERRFALNQLAKQGEVKLFMKYAATWQIPVNALHLKRLIAHHWFTNEKRNVDVCLHLARLLAAKSDRHAHILRKALMSARKHALENGKLRDADVFATECEQPLTLEDFTKALETFRERISFEEEEAPFVRERIIEFITQKSNP